MVGTDAGVLLVGSDEEHVYDLGAINLVVASTMNLEAVRGGDNMHEVTGRCISDSRYGDIRSSL